MFSKCIYLCRICNSFCNGIFYQALTEKSGFCRQYAKFTCQHASLSENAFWKSRNGEKLKGNICARITMYADFAKISYINLCSVCALNYKDNIKWISIVLIGILITCLGCYKFFIQSFRTSSYFMNISTLHKINLSIYTRKD